MGKTDNRVVGFKWHPSDCYANWDVHDLCHIYVNKKQTSFESLKSGIAV